jgi:predicted  nucleic acid-binding Zn-ribbon protein
MADEIKVTGSVNLVEVVATLNHAVKEMGRLGEFVKEEGKDNRRRFEESQREVAEWRQELKDEIAALDKAQSLTDKDLKVFVAKVSGVVSAIVASLMWAVKAGILERFL